MLPNFLQLPGSIIGKGGDQIKELKESTDALIKVSRLNEYFPGTEERIILVMGELESAMEAVTFIHKKWVVLQFILLRIHRVAFKTKESRVFYALLIIYCSTHAIICMKL